MQQHGWVPDTWCQVKGARCKGLHTTRFHVHCFCGRQSLRTEEQVNSGSQKSRGELITGKYRGILGAVTLFASVLLVMWLYMFAKTCSEVRGAQLCPTLCDPTDYTVHGILLARILQWVAVPFSRESSQPRDWTQVSCIAGGFFTSWATREIPKPAELYPLKSEFYSM